MFSNVLLYSWVICGLYSDASCRVTWIMFNWSFDLVIYNDDESGGIFSPVQIKISAPERNKPLTDNNVSQGTIFINGTHFSLFAQLLFFFTEIKEYKMIKKSISFTLTFCNYLRSARVHLPPQLCVKYLELGKKHCYYQNS